MARSLEAAGTREMDINLPPGLANRDRDYKDGVETVGAEVIPKTSFSHAKIIMVLRDYKTTTLVTALAFTEQLMDHSSTRSAIPTS